MSVPPSTPPPDSLPADSWRDTLERVARAVVSIRVDRVRSFDGARQASAQATGFVVDRELGLVLTNRHVVGAGPVVAEALFLNHEELPLRAVYRDPVHDFGFFRYDPGGLSFMEPSRLPLGPERARVGTAIRVVGNDAGEKLSILSGTLARLDRDAPHYSSTGYNDFNTFYLQAASSTSGGSSGSPVVDREGYVVGLNAGGSTQAASSFYLPLDRVVRAFSHLREGRDVPRGTLQTVFRHRSYDEIRRLGLSRSEEERIRRLRPEARGLLVVEEVLPEGPASGILEPGDILLGVQGRTTLDFVALETALDDAVGRSLVLDIQRGGDARAVEVVVQDLHAITPAALLEVGGGVVHALSYQQARNRQIPVRGVYVAKPGYMLERARVPRHAVIVEVGGEPTPDLEAFEAALAPLPHGTITSARFLLPHRPEQSAVATVTMDRRWYPMLRRERDDTTGTWGARPAPPAPDPEPVEPASTDFGQPEPGPAGQLAPSLVQVTCTVPFESDGVHASRFHGAGLVMDTDHGLVVVDRNTVPIANGDIFVTVAGSVRVEATLRYLHPLHNLAVIAYDPSGIGDTPVRAASLDFTPPAPGDPIVLVGMQENHRLVSRRTTVAFCRELALPMGKVARFRETNLEVLVPAESLPTIGGVLADDEGGVRALWASFFYTEGKARRGVFQGLPAELVQEALDLARRGASTPLRSLEVELAPLPLAQARLRGLSPERAEALSSKNPHARQLLVVARRVAGTPAQEHFRDGDLLLAIDGSPVTRFREVERAVQKSRVSVTVLRDGRERTVEVPTVALDGRGTSRLLRWAGALLQEPHRAVRLDTGSHRQGLYNALYSHGSPASRYGLRATRRIVAVDGHPVSDLDDFLARVAHLGDRDSVRLLTVDNGGIQRLITLELDLTYWPTWEIRWGERGWERRSLDGGPVSG